MCNPAHGHPCVALLVPVRVSAAAGDVRISLFRFQLKSLGEEHKWRSKTKAEREGNHCSMSPCMSKPRNRWTTKSVAASGITSEPSNRSTWRSKVPWFFHKYQVHFPNWKSKCLNYIQQRSHQTRWSHGCLNLPISFLPSAFFLWRSSNMLSTKPKRQLDMESIDDGLKRRFHPGMCNGSVAASAQMAILDDKKMMIIW